MDILNKMKVPELKSVLREYKKVHYQPYSKLNREGLIKLIVHHKLHENDLSKHMKVKVITKKKTQPKKDEKKPEQEIKSSLLSEYYDFILPYSSGSVDTVRGRAKEIIEMVNKFISKGKGIIDANMVTVALKLKDLAENLLRQRIKAQTKTKSVSTDYLTRIHKKYPTTNISNLRQAEKWIKEKFIDNGFASKIAFAMRENVTIPTKRSLRNNPEGTRGKEEAQKLRSAQENARSLVKPLIPSFHATIKNPVMVEIFSNMMIDKDNLIDVLDSDAYFRAAFALTYGKKSIYTDTPDSRRKVIELVTNDKNTDVITQIEAEKIIARRNELKRERWRKEQNDLHQQTQKDKRNEKNAKRQEHIRKVMNDKDYTYKEAVKYIKENKAFIYA